MKRHHLHSGDEQRKKSETQAEPLWRVDFCAASRAGRGAELGLGSPGRLPRGS